MRGNSAEEVAERVLSQTSIGGLQVIIRKIIASNANVLCVVLGYNDYFCV